MEYEKTTCLGSIVHQLREKLLAKEIEKNKATSSRNNKDKKPMWRHEQREKQYTLLPFLIVHPFEHVQRMYPTRVHQCGVQRSRGKVPIRCEWVYALTRQSTTCFTISTCMKLMNVCTSWMQLKSWSRRGSLRHIQEDADEWQEETHKFTIESCT